MSDYTHFDLSFDDDGVAWLAMDAKGRSVNVFAQEVMAELIAAIDEIAARTPAGFVFSSAKPRGFIFGADVNEFARFATAAEVEAHIADVLGCFAAIEAMGCPTVILIDGICVGGGFELALAFDRIIAIDDAACQVGFPEINLGLLPGYGGSVRAWERMGPETALQLVLHGKPMKAREAFEANAIDHLVAARDDLVAAGRDAIAGGIARRPAPKAGDMTAIIESERAALLARTNPRNMPAPFGILDHYSVKEFHKNNMIKEETKLFSKLMLTPASIGMRRNFQLTDMVKKGGRGNHDVSHVHVIGAGTMGGDIAAVAAMAGFEVTLQDISSEAVERATGRARDLFERRLKAPEKVQQALARLRSDVAGDGLPDADLLIEAVAEDLDIKRSVFAEAEARMKPDAIMATNTSAIPLEEIGTALASPERLIGMHFFNPVPVLPLVEVVYADASDRSFVDRAMYVCGALKKLPVMCKSAPGFLVNRALLPYLFKAVEAVLDGADPDRIDQALVTFGMPMGPIELCDQVGIDVCLGAGQVTGMSPVVAARFTAMSDAGQMGRKSGSGFYEWDGKKAIRPRGSYDPEELDIIAAEMLEPLVAECRAAVDEGVVESADVADAACIFGIGFPAFRGGALFWDESRAS